MNVKSKQAPFVIWFTGLSGSGKTTLAQALVGELAKKYQCRLLDGDVLRQLKPNLGFSIEDRKTHNQAVIDLCKNETQSDIIVVAMITPFEEIRTMARKQIPNYFEVYLSTPLEVCEKRDPKGLYQKARLGEIKNFTGIGQEYETPKNPDIEMDTSQMSVSDSLVNLLKAIHGPLSS